MSLFRFGFVKTSAGASGEARDSDQDENITTEPTSGNSDSDADGESRGESKDSDAPQPEKKRKKTRVRKYDHSYLRYGFVSTGGEIPIPLCVVCSKTLANESMKPTNLERHLKTQHPELQNKPIEHFERLKSEMSKQQTNKKNW